MLTEHMTVHMSDKNNEPLSHSANKRQADASTFPAQKKRNDVQGNPAPLASVAVDSEFPPGTCVPPQTALSTWVTGRLTVQDLATPKRDIINQLLLLNDITSIKIFGSLSAEDVREVIESADPKLTPGLRRHMIALYEEAREIG